MGHTQMETKGSMPLHVYYSGHGWQSSWIYCYACFCNDMLYLWVVNNSVLPEMPYRPGEQGNP
jgi:hypothetical protein